MSRDTSLLPSAPNAVTAKAIALGRGEAAADVLWLRTIQFIGSPNSEKLNYRGIESWIHAINTLSPKFQLPYYTGSILLATEPDRADSAVHLMDNAIQNLSPARCLAQASCETPDDVPLAEAYEQVCKPCDAYKECEFDMYLWRAFVSYFGKFDNKSAAHFYCEAAKRGGPEYLQRMAPRLARQETQCADLRKDLGSVQSSGRDMGKALDNNRRFAIAIECEKERIKRATQRAKIDRKPPKSIQDLLDGGFLPEAPWTPSPNACWKLEPEGPLLVNCR